MDAPIVFLLATTILFIYCTGGSWMLQNVSYPTYAHVGEAEFINFHKDSGRRLIPIFVVPAVIACWCSIILVFWRPATMPIWVGVISAICGLVILVTTLAIEVPKHNKLDSDGKSMTLINGLVRDNLPRAISWTLGSAVLVFGLLQVLIPRG
jgi:hypothetical protein